MTSPALVSTPRSSLEATCNKYGLLPAQTAHRLQILKHSALKDGDEIIEIGCGQGDCTSVMALLYPNSHITAIDPASLDYGSPETLGEAHQRIKSYEFGNRITFLQTTPEKHLATVEDGTYHVAVLCHSLWYFPDREKVQGTMEALRRKAKRMFVAEWALESSSSEAEVHRTVALARGLCEAHIPDSDLNIHTTLSPNDFKNCAVAAGWSLRSEESITPSAELEDGRWEVHMLLHEDGSGQSEFLARVKENIEDEKIYHEAADMLERVKKSVATIGGKKNVRCMDVWCGLFV